MSKKPIYLRILLVIAVIIILILSVYTLLYGNFNSLFTPEVWTAIGNIVNGISFVGIVLSFFFLHPLSFLKKMESKNFPSSSAHPPKTSYDALLFTVSKADIPIWMMKHYQPKSIGLIGSDEVLESLNKIKEDAKKLEIKIYCRSLVAADVDVVARAKHETLEIIQALLKAGSYHLALDITGGKTPMSIGAFLAAEEEGIDSLYVTAAFDKGRPISETIKPILLSGQKAG
jgi:hypothetical protein